MPKRIVDGEGIWESDRIRAIEPARFRAEYANLLPLALANGVFECDPLRVWQKVYCFNRPDVSYDDTKTILDELEKVGLLYRWTDEQKAKEWGYFTGIDKPGRLPPPTQRERMECGPNPPSKGLKEYIESHHNPRTVLGQSLLGLGLVRVGGGNGKSSHLRRFSSSKSVAVNTGNGAASNLPKTQTEKPKKGEAFNAEARGVIQKTAGQ